MPNQIKIRRALRSSAIGQYPNSARAMLDILPESTVSALTGAQLAQLLDALWLGCQRTKAIHERDIIAEGAIWDDCRGCLREIA